MGDARSTVVSDELPSHCCVPFGPRFRATDYAAHRRPDASARAIAKKYASNARAARLRNFDQHSNERQVLTTFLNHLGQGMVAGPSVDRADRFNLFPSDDPRSAMSAAEMGWPHPDTARNAARKLELTPFQCCPVLFISADTAADAWCCIQPLSPDFPIVPAMAAEAFCSVNLLTRNHLGVNI